jgi:hypothetical protein
MEVLGEIECKNSGDRVKFECLEEAQPNYFWHN